MCAKSSLYIKSAAKIIQYLPCCLPGEVHVVYIDRNCGHPLLCFFEVVSEWGHFCL